MRKRMLESLTAEELAEVERWISAHPKAKAPEIERYARAVRRPRLVDERHERTQRYLWNLIVPRSDEFEPDVHTANAVATTRTRCDFHGNVDSDFDPWDEIDGLHGFDGFDQRRGIVHPTDDEREACDIVTSVRAAFCDDLNVDADDAPSDLLYLQVLIDLSEKGEGEPPYDERCKRSGNVSVWSSADHGPLGGPEAYECWLNRVLWQETISGTKVERPFTRRDRIGQIEHVADQDDLDRVFFGRLDYQGLRMPEVFDISGWMSLKAVEDYHKRCEAREEDVRRRGTVILKVDTDHEFEEIDGDEVKVPEPAEPRNGSVVKVPEPAEPIVPTSPNPAAEPEFDDAEYEARFA